jgi:hypothetical protein
MEISTGYLDIFKRPEDNPSSDSNFYAGMNGYWNPMYLNPFSKTLLLFERKRGYIDICLTET